MSIYEDLRLAYTMPTQPDAARGFVFPESVNHGTRIYLNEQELVRRNRVQWLFASAVLPFGAMGFLQQQCEVFPPYARRKKRLRREA